jgi:hypothetical protein
MNASERSPRQTTFTPLLGRHLHPPVAIQHRSRQAGDLVGVADVDDDRQSRPTRRGDLVGDLLGELGVDIGDDHVGAMLCEQLRGCRADTTTAARHYRDPVGQQRTSVYCLLHAHILGHGPRPSTPGGKPR